MSKPANTQDAGSSKKQKNRSSLSDLATPKKTKKDSLNDNSQKIVATKPTPLQETEESVHPLERLLGASVTNSSGLTVNPQSFAVENGVLGLYFAAHWCPPCRTLTPKIALLYDKLKKDDKNFEVVFVSFDYSLESFTQYFSKMPWYALDYSELDKRMEVAEHFDIKGIPVLIILDANSGDIITLNGREMINFDPKGLLFPWKMEETEAALDTVILQEVQSATSPRHSKVSAQDDSKPPEPDNKLSEDIPAAVGDINTE